MGPVGGFDIPTLYLKAIQKKRFLRICPVANFF